jgi:hypothetical protein
MVFQSESGRDAIFEMIHGNEENDEFSKKALNRDFTII